MMNLRANILLAFSGITHEERGEVLHAINARRDDLPTVRG